MLFNKYFMNWRESYKFYANVWIWWQRLDIRLHIITKCLQPILTSVKPPPPSSVQQPLTGPLSFVRSKRSIIYFIKKFVLKSMSVLVTFIQDCPNALLNIYLSFIWLKEKGNKRLFLKPPLFPMAPKSLTHLFQIYTFKAVMSNGKLPLLNLPVCQATPWHPWTYLPFKVSWKIASNVSLVTRVNSPNFTSLANQFSKWTLLPQTMTRFWLNVWQMNQETHLLSTAAFFLWVNHSDSSNSHF